MKKVIRIFIVIALIIITVSQFSFVYADDAGGGTSLKPADWDPAKYRNLADESKLDFRAKVITTTIRSVGIIVSVVTLMVIGIKEMTASAEEKSVIKQAMPGYILGAIMVFSMTVIPTLIYEWAKEL